MRYLTHRLPLFLALPLALTLTVGESLACPPCDDGNLCTTDYCDPATNICAHVPIRCDDNSPCTTDSCSPTIGCQFVAHPNGEACSDGNACTTGDHCQAGSCVGTTTNCNDNNACTYDDCDPATGQCRHDPQGCDDSNPCTIDSCNPATGQCTYAPMNIGDACNDGNTCTTSDHCVAGPGGITCVGTATTGAPCDDGQPCTVNDLCQSGTVGGIPTCQGTFLTCNDGNACTDDYCDGNTGQCVHQPRLCDDGNDCTTDSCNTSTGCVNQPLPTGTSCNDTEPCTINDVCVLDPRNGLICKGTPNLGAACNDLNTCTYGDQCVAGGRFGATCMGTSFNCEDGNPCTTNQCHQDIGQCVVGPTVCNDYNTCTDDSCSQAMGGCQFTPRPNGSACDDFSPCTSGDMCQSGSCIGQPLNCDDGNPCTTDSCGEGCVHQPINCSDGLPCTADSCDPATGQCVFTPYPNGTQCADSNPCTVNESCQGGSCQGQPATCDDGNSCTTDTCDFMMGCRNTPQSDGTPCNDGSACTTGDACASGVCSGIPVILIEVSQVSFATHAKLQWAPTPQGQHWNSYRGTIPHTGLGSRPPGAVYDHTCYESADEFGDGPTVSIDPTSPPVGTGYYYLVTEENACGEGPLGNASSGAPRPNASPCPTPP
jgi:hypothetical protein